MADHTSTALDVLSISALRCAVCRMATADADVRQDPTVATWTITHSNWLPGDDGAPFRYLPRPEGRYCRLANWINSE